MYHLNIMLQPGVSHAHPIDMTKAAEIKANVAMAGIGLGMLPLAREDADEG